MKQHFQTFLCHFANRKQRSFFHGNSLVADVPLLYGASPQTLADKEILVLGVWNSRILKKTCQVLVGRSMTRVC